MRWWCSGRPLRDTNEIGDIERGPRGVECGGWKFVHVTNLLMNRKRQQMQQMFVQALKNYSRRYILTGSSAPVFHAMGGVFVCGVLIHAKQHNDHVKDPIQNH